MAGPPSAHNSKEIQNRTDCDVTTLTIFRSELLYPKGPNEHEHD